MVTKALDIHGQDLYTSYAYDYPMDLQKNLFSYSNQSEHSSSDSSVSPLIDGAKKLPRDSNGRFINGYVYYVRNPHHKIKFKTDSFFRHKEWLRQKYIEEKLSACKIAKICKCTSSTIYLYLKKFNLPIRVTTRHGKFEDKSWLKQKYIGGELSTGHIGFICGVSQKLIWGYLKKFNIPLRTRKQSRRAKGNPHYKKGRIRNSNGYILLQRPDHPNCDPRGYVKEHRLIIEESIGRFLNSGEIIHHKNKIRSDNRIENLILCKNSSEHFKLYHNKGRIIHGKWSDKEYRNNHLREHKKKNKEIYKKIEERYREKNKEKVLMRQRTRKKYSHFKTNCQTCSSSKELEFHHIDYSSDENFEILCRECHQKLK